MDMAYRQVDRHGMAVAAHLTTDQIRERVLEHLSVGLVVCECSGFVRFANPCAEDALAAGTLLRRVGQTLRCAGASDPSFEDTLRDGGRTHGSRLVALSHGADRLLVSVEPLWWDASAEPLMLVMLGRRALCTAQGLELLSAHHGLTAAEHRVLGGLLDERTPQDIALAHAVALTTVRTQIAAIETKFEAHSVEALLRRVAEIPPVPDAPTIRRV